MFSAKDAIVKYFQSTEAGIDKNCENCSYAKCSKHTSLLWSPEFILVQFKRFKARRALRSREAVISKIKEETEAFSTVDINTTRTSKV